LAGPQTPLGGAYSASSGPLAGIKGPTSERRGREGEGKRKGREGKGEEGRRGEGREREGCRKGKEKGREKEGSEGRNRGKGGEGKLAIPILICFRRHWS